MLVNMTEAEWDAVIKVHLKGTFAPARHAAAYWRDRAKAAGEPVDARLINTTSVSGIYGNAGQTNYGAAKAGIAAFTIIAARELRRYGVTVNAIAPGALTRHDRGPRLGQCTDGGEGAQRTRAGSRRSSPGWRATESARRHRPRLRGVRQRRARRRRGLAPRPDRRRRRRSDRSSGRSSTR